MKERHMREFLASALQNGEVTKNTLLYKIKTQK